MGCILVTETAFSDFISIVTFCGVAHKRIIDKTNHMHKTLRRRLNELRQGGKSRSKFFLSIQNSGF